MSRTVFGTMLIVMTLGGSSALAADDPFAEGTVWQGVRYHGQNKKNMQDWTLKITERKKTEFKGVMSFDVDGKLQEFEVTGTAPEKGDGAVKFKSEKKGFFSQSFVGKIKGGEVALEFSGTHVAGGKTSGTATLKPKN